MTNLNKVEEKIVINKEAFRNMLTHALRFSNIPLNKRVPVMGLCLGKINQNSNILTIFNSIPIKHGSSVDENFSSEDLDAFKKIEQKFSSEDLIVLGWYRSNSINRLSENDEVNQLYFQKSKNSRAFCVIVNYELIGNDSNFGLNIFRINDFDKPNEHQSLSHEIQVPNTLEYFKWCQKFMEDFQKNSPILIKEVNELVEAPLGELQEIPSTGEDYVEKAIESKFSEINPILSGFSNGASGFIEIFNEIFKTQLGDWTNDINQGILNGTQELEFTINQMKKVITTGFSKIQGWFDRSANEIIGNFNSSVSKYINEKVAAQKDVAIDISNSKNEIVDFLRKSIEDQFNSIFKKIEEDFEKISLNIAKIHEMSSNVEEKINFSLEKMNSILNNLATVSEEIRTQVESTNELYEIKLSDEIQGLSSEIIHIEESYSNLEDFIQKLQKIAKEYKKI